MAISCGLHNPFGHPSPATLARLAAYGVTTFCTARSGAITFVSGAITFVSGAITFVSDGDTVTARPFLP